MQTENEQGLLRRSDALTLEEIQASTDLSGKIASAEALKNARCYLVNRSFNFVNGIATTDYSFNDVVVVSALENTGWDNLSLVPYADQNTKIWRIKDLNGKNQNNVSVSLVLMKRY